MKWCIGLLLVLNIAVFALAFFSDNEQSDSLAIRDVPANTDSVKLLSSSSTRIAGNCTNLGPIGQKIVIDRFQQLLKQQSIAYKLIQEPAQKVNAYRVVIKQSDEYDSVALKEKLKATGVDEVYDKISASGEAYLSLGLFTYRKTAQDFAANLTQAGFPAVFENESLNYPERYWLNLTKALDGSIISQLNEYIGATKLTQTQARCL